MTPTEKYWKERCEAAEKYISSNKTTDYKNWTTIRHTLQPSPESVGELTDDSIYYNEESINEFLTEEYSQDGYLHDVFSLEDVKHMLFIFGKMLVQTLREDDGGSRWRGDQECLCCAERMKTDPINFLLSNALRNLNEEKLIALRNALIERTPKTNTCCARWVKASERLPDKELGRVFAKHLGVKNNLHYIFNAWTLSSNAKTIEESDLINIEWLDESPCILHAGWMPGTPPLDKPCVFVSKSGSDYSVWEVINLNTGDGSYLAICDGDGNEWGDISDFRCDSYYMLSPTIFPTREQAEKWAYLNLMWIGSDSIVQAISMYEWIVSLINKQK